jgi:hypothetical protein
LLIEPHWLPAEVSIQPRIEFPRAKGGERFRDDGLENEGRDFMPSLWRELRPFLIPNAWSERGAVEMLPGSSPPLRPDQLDAPVVSQSLDVISNLLHVLSDQTSNLGCARFAFIEDLKSVDSNRMLHDENDKLIDAAWLYRRVRQGRWPLSYLQHC